jgi:hypothetical protein
VIGSQAERPPHAKWNYNRGVMLRFRHAAFAAVAATLGLSGCAYRMAAPFLRSQQRIRIVANSPERYTVHVQTSDYRAEADGRVSFDISMAHRGCSVYLFDRIPIRRMPGSTREKVISVMLNGRPVRRLSLLELSRLPVDGAGYHQLPIY